MSFARSVPLKKNDPSMAIPPLPKPIAKRPSLLPTAVKKDVKAQETKTNDAVFSIPADKNNLKEIVNNLSTIVQRSEELLTPIKPVHITTTVRRTASLHLTKVELDRRKLAHSILQSSNSYYHNIEKNNHNRSKLHDSISDRSSECNMSISSSVPRRTSIRSLHNAEKYSGIKCALPSFTSTLPSTLKGLEKHYTPIKSKQSNNSILDNQITPANTNGRDKSPWRLRFEKFLNHEEPTPLSPAIDANNSVKTKISSINKENRTPSFRLPARRTSKLNLPSE